MRAQKPAISTWNHPTLENLRRRIKNIGTEGIFTHKELCIAVSISVRLNAEHKEKKNRNSSISLNKDSGKYYAYAKLCAYARCTELVLQVEAAKRRLVEVSRSKRSLYILTWTSQKR